MRDHKNLTVDLVVQPREYCIEVCPNEIELPIIVPVADLMRVVVDNTIGRPTSDRAGRGDGEDTPALARLEVICARMSILDSGRECLLIPGRLHHTADLAAKG